MILSLLLISCGKKLRIAANDLSFNVYKGGETLIFKSNTGSIEKIYVKKIDKSFQLSDPLAVFPNKYEILKIFVHFSDSNYVATLENLQGPIFSISTFKDNLSDFKFSFQLNNAHFYSNSFDSKIINSLSTQDLNCNGKIYKDVIKILPTNLECIDREDYITAIYWSKSKGYVRCDLKNNKYWQLE